MTALAFLAFNAIKEIFEISRVFVNSGFSFTRSFYYLKAKRNRFLFLKYCQELWLQQQSQICALLNRNSNGEMSEVDFTAIPADCKIFDREEDLEQYIPNEIKIIHGQEILSTFNDCIETVPIYQNSDLGNIHEGVSFIVSGFILPNCERFSINLIIATTTRDVALHINPRLPQNYIVRNTKVKDIWGGEEVSSALPFSLRRGSKFSIQILITDTCYMISVNGNHFAEYTHRLPYKSISCLEVKGDVDNVAYKRCVVTAYPIRHPDSQAKNVALKDEEDKNGSEDRTEITTQIHGHSEGLPLPYYGRLPIKSFGPGKCLKIQGRVKLLPHSFYINLQCGQNIWPHPTVAFHFNPRFARRTGGLGRHVVCRNSWQAGHWDKEEASELTTDFCPGKPFSMDISCCSEIFEVYVNGKLVTEFRFRVRPEIVDTIYIQGDIKLWDVVLQSNSVIKSEEKSAYPKQKSL